MFRQSLFACLLACSAAASGAQAEVRFGNHVYIGGHDVSHQTFNRQRRAIYYLSPQRPHPEGCAWRSYRDGSRTKVCHLQQLR